MRIALSAEEAERLDALLGHWHDHVGGSEDDAAGLGYAIVGRLHDAVKRAQARPAGKGRKT